MDSYFWAPWRSQVPQFQPTATCRHGDHRIERLESGTWVDAEGFTTCVKGALDNIGDDEAQVAHEPIPDGLIGEASR